jgi:hypothetical protein
MQPDLEIVELPASRTNQYGWAIRDTVSGLWRTGQHLSGRSAWSQWQDYAKRFGTQSQAQAELDSIRTEPGERSLLR